MKTAVMFLVNGFEEAEAIVPADILRRGGVSLLTVSLTGERMVTGSHNIPIEADRLFDEIADKSFDMLVLPGGPGTDDYLLYDDFVKYLKNARKKGKYIAAICAAPTVLARLGLLEGKTATVFPGRKSDMNNVTLVSKAVVTDGHIITGRAAGSAFDFGLEALRVLCGIEVRDEIAKKMVYVTV